MTTLAQRIGQEFKVLRDNELTLKADQTNLNAEITRATSAEATLTNNLNAEITARIDADTTLQAAVDSKVDGSGGVAGDILYHNGTSFVKLAAGTTGQILRIGSGGLPEWADPLIQ